MFSHTFATGGVYFYYCTQHGTPTSGMKGSVVVTAPNTPPVVTITNPVSGTVLSAPANVTIQASATDDGPVTNVQFLVGTTLMTNKTATPYFAVTNNLPTGSYTFTAIASDNRGIKSTNTISITVVTPLPLTVNAAQFSSASFQLSFTANSGLSYVIQQSTNLTAPNWIPLLTNTAASNPMVFVDSHATNSPRFYRVGRLPNP